MHSTIAATIVLHSPVYVLIVLIGSPLDCLRPSNKCKYQTKKIQVVFKWLFFWIKGKKLKTEAKCQRLSPAVKKQKTPDYLQTSSRIHLNAKN